MKVRIDTGRCTGHGRCYTVAPELFVDDDDGYGQVRGDGIVGDADIAAASRAVSSCPESAVSLDP